MDAFTVGNIGAAAELVASADLMSLGYEVFRAANPLGPTDLVIRTPGGEVFFVEVKTAYKKRFTQKAKLDADVADVMALVDLDSYTVRYYGIGSKLWGHTSLRLVYPTMLPFPKD